MTTTPTTALDWALYYASRGWRVIPIKPGFKYPHGIERWQEKATTDAERITAHWTAHPDDGIGIATGPESGLFVVDIDPDDGGDDSLRALEQRHGELPDTIEAVTGGGGRHLLFAWPDGVEIHNSASGVLGVGIDVRGIGGQILAAPTVHPVTGQRYQWEIEHDPLDGLVPTTAPEWLVQLLTTAPKVERPRREPEEVELNADLPGAAWVSATTWADELQRDGWTLHSTHADSSGASYEMWTRPGKDVREGASASLYYRGSNVLKVFTPNAPPLQPDETYTLWGYHVATKHGGDFQAAARAQRKTMNAATTTTSKAPTMTDAPPAAIEAAAAGGPEHLDQQPFSDLGNARRLVAEHGHDLRHAPQLGRWLAWDGQRWAEDVTGAAHRRAKMVVDGMLTQLATISDADDRKRLFGHWMRSQGASRLTAMVDVARTEPGIPVLVHELDADPWSLNTPEGVVDLRTGTVAPAERRALVTKLATARPVTGATCPTWLAFLDWAMQGDDELVGFVQRAVGYSLTGRVDEQVLFFLHGFGENGKSTFLNVLQAMLGDYAIAAEPDLLIASQGDKHSTGVADLVGRRVAVVQETEEGRRFAEATVKQLTGGDVIRARRMRQDFFEFRPTHKLWMAANHKPNVRGTDHAIWRRIRLIPFTASLAPGQKDERLLDKLLAELPGIMAWALEGCLLWQRDGLRPPAVVVQATAEYRTEQDHVGRFIDDVCVLDEGQCVSARDLRKAYESWCEENGERPWSAKAMAPQLVERACERVKVGREKEWTWIGIGLIDQPRPIDLSVAMGRVGRSMGSTAALAAHSEWAAPETDLPGALQERGPCGPSTRYTRSAHAQGELTSERAARAANDVQPDPDDLF